MSHELRTPLNAVIGFSEVLLDRMFGEINERQDEYLRDIRNSGKHLLELLNEILDLSKVEAGHMVLEPSTFSVGSAVEYTLAMVRERATLHAHRRHGAGCRRRRHHRRRRTPVQAGGAQPGDQRRQVHPRRRQRRHPRVPRGDRARGHRDRHRHRGAARGPGTDLRVLPAGRPGSPEGGGHRSRPDVVPTNGRAVRRADVARQHPGCREHVRLLRPWPAGRRREDAAPKPASFPVIVLLDEDRASQDLVEAYLDGIAGRSAAGLGRRQGPRADPHGAARRRRARDRACRGWTAGRSSPRSRPTPPPQESR